jgi:hypothetical protein
VVDLSLISLLATRGILMARIPLQLLGTVIAATALFALILDEVKLLVFQRLSIVKLALSLHPLRHAPRSGTPPLAPLLNISNPVAVCLCLRLTG